MAMATLKRLEVPEFVKQPFIKSGDKYEYTSYCPLPTDFGVMHGYFEMIAENGRKFNAKISPFRLSTLIQLINF